MKATTINAAAAVLVEMQHGAALHLQFSRAGPSWALSTGKKVDNNVARLIITSGSVAAVGDALFRDTPSQTYRWWAQVEEPAA